MRTEMIKDNIDQIITSSGLRPEQEELCDNRSVKDMANY